ncbi:MAG: 6,7-dimethyl-8-ribityllumazine synthase, partial [Acidobacteriaceae bacterium]|nr:6,7-dimethyl-8-ribityllumazine synthase [Acidobacteriaceae bacterium]
QAGAIAKIEAAGTPAEITVVRVPGAFEIPSMARHVAETDRYDAVIGLGCLIRGATPHFEIIANAVAHGLIQASGETGIPMSFGVLTTNSVEEALERAVDGPSNKGWEAAAAAIGMANLTAQVTRSDPAL